MATSSDHLVKIGREGFGDIDACKGNKRSMSQLPENPNYYCYYTNNNNKAEKPVGTINHREAARKYKGVNVEQRCYYKAEPNKPKSPWSFFFQAFKF